MPRVACLRRRRNKAPSIGLSPHVYLAGHRGGSRSARMVICWKRAILWPPDHVLPDVPSSLALIFRSKISIDFRTYFFRDKYSAPRISPLLASLVSSYPFSPDSWLLKALNYVPWSVPIPDARMSPYPVDILCFLTATHKIARLGSHRYFPANIQ